MRCFVCCDGESSQFLHSLCLKFNSPNKTLVCCQSLSFSHFCSQSHTGSHCLCKGVTVSSGVPYCGYMLKVCVYFSCFVYQKSCYFFFRACPALMQSIHAEWDFCNYYYVFLFNSRICLHLASCLYRYCPSLIPFFGRRSD